MLACFIFAFASEKIDVISSSLYHANDHNTQNIQYIIPTENAFLKESLPGLNFFSSGQEGRSTELSLRGAKPQQTLVMLDGIPLNNPATGGSFDFADFMTHDVAAIEVLPGSQGTLYGSEALGGAINIVTRPGGKREKKVLVEGGSHKTYRFHGRTEGEEGPVNYAFNATGFTSGNGTFQNGPRAQGDDYRTQAGTAHLSYAVTPTFDWETTLRLQQSRVRWDDLSTGLPQAWNAHTKTTQGFGSTRAHWSFHEDKGEQMITFGFVSHRAGSESPFGPTESLGQRFVLSSRTDYHFSPALTSTIGVTGQRESTLTHSRHTLGLSLNQAYKPVKSLLITGGIRADFYNRAHLTYRFGASYSPLENTRFMANVSTGFKAPVLSDLYDQSAFTVPNPSLKPEKSLTFDLGIEQFFLEKALSVSLTAFHLKIKDIIESTRLSDGKFQRINRDERLNQGLESRLSYAPSPTFSIAWSMTYLKPRADLIRQPRQIHALQTTYTPTKKVKFYISAQSVSSAKDLSFETFPAKTLKLKSYTLFNLGGEYQFYKGITLYGRGENLTDQQYEKVYGYGMRGRSFYGGFSVAF